MNWREYLSSAGRDLVTASGCTVLNFDRSKFFSLDYRAAHDIPRSTMVRICGTSNSSAVWPSAE